MLGFTGVFGPKGSVPFEYPHLSLPSDHPASIQFSAWLHAFNSGDRKTLLDYHIDSNFPYSVMDLNIENELIFARITGGFHVAEIESTSSPSTVIVLLKEKDLGRYARASMDVDNSKSGYPVTKFQLNLTHTPLKFIPKDDPRRPKYEKALQPLSSELRRKLVESLTGVLREQYVNPEVGDEIIQALEHHLKSGDYDNYEDSEEFAVRLSDDMAVAGNDKHMFIGFIEPFSEDENPNRRPDIEDNHGFEPITFDTTSIHGRTIATLPIESFVESSKKKVRAAISKILSSVADADALIVDLRSNHGGDPETIAFMLSYLLDSGPIHTLDFVDKNGKVQDSSFTVAGKKLPKDAKRFGGSKPLYVLTTKDTFSGGEDMAYNLHAFKRATAIVGEGNESTAGAANPVTKSRFICRREFGKQWWVVGVPDLKPVSKVTGTNWEGKGVRSDVVAGEGVWKGVEDAREVAIRLVRGVLEPEVKKEL